MWRTDSREGTSLAGVNWEDSGWGQFLAEWPMVPPDSQAYGEESPTRGTEYMVYIDPGPVIRVHPPPIGTIFAGAGFDSTYQKFYDFTDGESFQNFCELVVSANCNTWSLEDSFVFNNSSWQGKVFVPNKGEDYSINVQAKLEEGTTGGYGVFFDTRLKQDGSGDSGYIFQFDRGFGEGQFVVRPRVEGSEGNRVASFASRNIEGIPTKEEDPHWWASPRDIEVKVSSQGSDQRKAEFYIDGIKIGEYTYDYSLDPDSQYYTGLRGWHAQSEFYSLEISP